MIEREKMWLQLAKGVRSSKINRKQRVPMLTGWFCKEWRTAEIRAERIDGQMSEEWEWEGRQRRPRTPWLVQMNTQHRGWAREDQQRKAPWGWRKIQGVGVTEARRWNVCQQERGVDCWEVRNEEAREGSDCAPGRFSTSSQGLFWWRSWEESCSSRLHSEVSKCD